MDILKMKTWHFVLIILTINILVCSKVFFLGVWAPFPDYAPHFYYSKSMINYGIFGSDPYFGCGAEVFKYYFPLFHLLVFMISSYGIPLLLIYKIMLLIELPLSGIFAFYLFRNKLKADDPSSFLGGITYSALVMIGLLLIGAFPRSFGLMFLPLFFYLLYDKVGFNKLKNHLITGIIIGIGFITHMNLFVALLIFLFFFSFFRRKNFNEFLLCFFIPLIIAFLVSAPWSVNYVMENIFKSGVSTEIINITPGFLLWLISFSRYSTGYLNLILFSLILSFIVYALSIVYIVKRRDDYSKPLKYINLVLIFFVIFFSIRMIWESALFMASFFLYKRKVKSSQRRKFRIILLSLIPLYIFSFLTVYDISLSPAHNDFIDSVDYIKSLNSSVMIVTPVEFMTDSFINDYFADGDYDAVTELSKVSYELGSGFLPCYYRIYDIPVRNMPAPYMENKCINDPEYIVTFLFNQTPVDYSLIKEIGDFKIYQKQ